MSRDHAGGDLPHVHGDEEAVAYELDAVRLRTFGLDIGTATTQVVLSQLVLARLPGTLSSAFTVVERHVRYCSPVHLTAFEADGRIDAQRLRAVVSDALAAGTFSRNEIDCGAVIVTGEAAARDNAQVVAGAVAAVAGDFVCVVAGHHLEAVLAAHGSRAVEASRQAHARILNVDIGGGTTKFSAIAGGTITATAALHVGGRLAAFDAGCLVRLEPVCARIAAALGIRWTLGCRVQAAEIRSVAAAMADAVIAAACGEPLPLQAEGLELWLTAPLAAAEFDQIRFSGGVAEYLDGDAPAGVDDLGAPLARELRARFVRLPGYVQPSAQRIRSTVIGASQYTIQLSGNTVFVSDERALPVRNIRAVRIAVPAGDAAIAGAVVEQVDGARRILEGAEPLAVMIEWHGLPTHARLSALVAGLAQSMRAQAGAGQPVCIALDADIGRLVGRMLAQMPGFERASIVSVDGLDVAAYDYLDIGRLDASGTVPVTIKSLLFGY
ncbi:MAG: ethanolamine ammonia-lyase reactivating factor EutA [Candidatus Lustribacter sp.]|jgi:ethanolamine utilization protein EutA